MSTAAFTYSTTTTKAAAAVSSTTTALLKTKKSIKKEKEEVHLISLPPLPSLKSLPKNSKHNFNNNNIIKYYPPILRQAWKWKDDTLGNGRDYILPKPRALKDFNSLLIGQSFQFCRSTEQNHNEEVKVTVEECATLSNCARLDILVAVKVDIVRDSSSSLSPSSLLPPFVSTSTTREAIKYIVSNCLAQQIYSQSKTIASTTSNKKASSWGNDLKRFFDLPGAVVTQQQQNNDNAQNNDIRNEEEYHQKNDDLEELYTNLKHTKSLPKIITHYALIASGMPKSHPSRPDTTASLIFRPYSSRDAHILCQLKRCTDVAIGTKVTLVLQEALRAGKASRDEGIVEEIGVLRKYGSGRSRFGDGDVPLDLSRMAAKAAKEKAIKPSIKRCIEKLNALNASTSISTLRQRADVLLQKYLKESKQQQQQQQNNDKNMEHDTMRKKINSILHQPCIDLREGKNVEVEDVLDCIEREIELAVVSQKEEEKRRKVESMCENGSSR